MLQKSEVSTTVRHAYSAGKILNFGPRPADFNAANVKGAHQSWVKRGNFIVKGEVDNQNRMHGRQVMITNDTKELMFAWYRNGQKKGPPPPILKTTRPHPKKESLNA